MNNPNRERRKVALKPAVKATGWSHQNELSALIGKTIRILTGTQTIEGMLLAADQFSVKVTRKSDPNNFVVVFKSSMTYFCEVKAATVSGDI